MRRELPREAFLGEMVVGHKNAKNYKSPFFHERIVRTFAKIVDTVGKRVCRVCRNVLHKLFVNMLFHFSENGVF